MELVHGKRHEVLELVVLEPRARRGLLDRATPRDDRHKELAERLVEAARLDEDERPADAHGLLGLAHDVLLPNGKVRVPRTAAGEESTEPHTAAGEYFPQRQEQLPSTTHSGR